MLAPKILEGAAELKENAGVEVPKPGVELPNPGVELPNAGVELPKAGVLRPNKGAGDELNEKAGVEEPKAGVLAPKGAAAEDAPKLKGAGCNTSASLLFLTTILRSSYYRPCTARTVWKAINPRERAESPQALEILELLTGYQLASVLPQLKLLMQPRCASPHA